MKLLRELVATPAVSGHEAPLRALVERELAPLVDEMEVDPLGNLIGRRRGSARERGTLLVTAHMDQIGFVVRDVDDRGFPRLQPIGWIDPRFYLGQACRIGHEDGRWLRGVITAWARPPHGRAASELEAAFGADDLFVQLIDPPGDEPIEPGAPVTVAGALHDGADAIVGGPLDDRVGVWTLLRALRDVREQPDDLIALFSVQEEVGLRGAAVAGHRLAPDLALAVDVAGAHDVPGADPRRSTLRSGAGVGLKVMDNRSIGTVPVRRALRALAREHGIAHQLHVEPAGGTDAAALQLSGDGVPSLALSIPTRYLHTPTEHVAKADLEACRALLAAAIGTPLRRLLYDPGAPTAEPSTSDASTSAPEARQNPLRQEGTA